MPKILAIVPCFNEGESVAGVVRKIKECSPGVDVLVVDDGSTDNTAAEAASEGAQVASLPINLGIGGAVQTGYRFALKEDYDAAVQVDGDGQHPPSEILTLAQAVLEGKADLAIGSRYADGFKEGNVSSLSRVLGSRVLSAVIFLLTGRRITDPTSGFRAVGKNLILQFSEDYPYDYPEPVSLIAAIAASGKVLEIPIRLLPRQHGASSIGNISSALYMIKVTWVMCLKRIYG